MKKGGRTTKINITSHILRIGIKLLILIFYYILALFLVTFVGDFLHLHIEELIDNNIIKSTIDTINKPLNTLNLKVNNIISDDLSVKYNFHINNYKHNLNTKRILYLNSVFENIIQDMHRFNSYTYSTLTVKFDSITNMCRYTEKYLYDNFLNVGINKLTIQEYFELINRIKYLKIDNPKLFYFLCDDIKGNLFTDHNTACQYLINKSYILDESWLREPHKLYLSNSWETLLSINKSSLNDNLSSPSTIIDLYSTKSINSTYEVTNLINTNPPSNYNSPIFRDKIRFTGMHTELYKDVSTKSEISPGYSPILNEVFSFNSRNSLVEGLGIFDNTTESLQDKDIKSSILKSPNTNQIGAELPITQNKSVRFNLKDNN